MPSPFDLAAYLSERKRWVDSALEACLPAATDAPGPIHEAMRYAVLRGGKRLRPILTLATTELTGTPPKALLHAACAIECVHAASLILDDLPCMDDAASRRNYPATHKAYGEATALLASMGLLALAFELAARNASALDHEAACVAATQVLANAIGSRGLVYGQHLDLHFTGGKPTLAELECVHHHKAGALFLASLELPARLLDMPEERVQALRQYGEHVGIAFQITDDLHDETAGTEDAGKSTFTTHLGRDGAKAQVHARIQTGIDALACFDARAEPLRQLAQHVLTRIH